MKNRIYLPKFQKLPYAKKKKRGANFGSSKRFDVLPLLYIPTQFCP